MKRLYIILAISIYTIKTDAQTPDYTFQWSRNASSSIISATKTVALDSLGNSYVAGTFMGGYMSLGNLNFNNSVSSGFIAKLKNDGSTVWLKPIGTNDQATVSKLKIDHQGNLVAYGEFLSATLTMGIHTIQNTLSDQQDVFIAKLDTAGNCLWLKAIGGTNPETATDMVIHENNDIEFVGIFRSDTLHADTIQVISNNPYQDQGMAGLVSTTGDFKWLKTIGNASFQSLRSIAVLPHGCSVMVGMEAWDIAMHKIDSLGNLVWSKVFPGDAFELDEALDVLCDSNQDIYTVGYFESPFQDFDTISFGGFSGRKGFLLKTDSLGNAIWMRPLRGNGSAEAQHISQNESGDILVAGSFTSSKFYPELLDTLFNQSYPGYSDVYLSSYDSNGNRYWTKQLGSVYHEEITDLTTSFNQLMIGGFYTSPFFTIPNTFTMFNSTGNEGMFIAKATVNTLTKLSSNESNTFILFPSPTKKWLNIRVDASFRKPLIRILDLTGQTILESNQSTIDVETLPAGMYIATLILDNKTAATRFIKE